IRNGSSIIAFTTPKERLGYTMFGAHTDSPNLKLKPNPVIKKEHTIQLGVEPYGGVLLNPWFDRDLAMAGRVAYVNEAGSIDEAIVDSKKAIAIIPSLAIHLDKTANSERSVNAQTDIVPMIATGNNFDFDTFVLGLLDAQGIKAKQVLSHELSLYDMQKASYVGIGDDFIASARLDNLLSCFVITKRLCDAKENEALLMVCSDHEEVGSESAAGAAGSFVENVLDRIENNHEKQMHLRRASLMVSCDNAHAIHPNFSSKHDANHAPHINKGIVVKVNANQRYASNSRTISRFTLAAQKAKEPLQEFVTRSDMGCGSTIGPITATRLGIETLDIGIPTFAMHSIRELCGYDDAYALLSILKAL
ncbi:MAG TPA: M18 family aminopeptidase, partial [Helicobacteraceae bacterium]|nr:M18 family aminopeptidase [Helicobacteraceae bacterium]